MSAGRRYVRWLDVTMSTGRHYVRWTSLCPGPAPLSTLGLKQA